MSSFVGIGVFELFMLIVEELDPIALNRFIVGDVIRESTERVDRMQRSTLLTRKHPERSSKAGMACADDSRTMTIGREGFC